MENMFDISGKIAVITGGSRGIGKMIAEGFVRAGVKTYITARSADAVRKLQKNFHNLVPVLLSPKI